MSQLLLWPDREKKAEKTKQNKTSNQTFTAKCIVMVWKEQTAKNTSECSGYGV